MSQLSPNTATVAIVVLAVLVTISWAHKFKDSRPLVITITQDGKDSAHCMRGEEPCHTFDYVGDNMTKLSTDSVIVVVTNSQNVSFGKFTFGKNTTNVSIIGEGDVTFACKSFQFSGANIDGPDTGNLYIKGIRMNECPGYDSGYINFVQFRNLATVVIENCTIQNGASIQFFFIHQIVIDNCIFDNITAPLYGPGDGDDPEYFSILAFKYDVTNVVLRYIVVNNSFGNMLFYFSPDNCVACNLPTRNILIEHSQFLNTLYSSSGEIPDPGFSARILDLHVHPDTVNFTISDCIFSNNSQLAQGTMTVQAHGDIMTVTAYLNLFHTNFNPPDTNTWDVPLIYQVASSLGRSVIYMNLNSNT